MIRICLVITALVAAALSRIHEISVSSDPRLVFPLMSFGLTTKGFIDVNMTSLSVTETESHLVDYGEWSLTE